MAALAALLFTGLLALSAVPGLFGEDVGAGFASVEHSLCALGADGSAGILIGGDSRAKVQLDPRLLDSMVSRKAINIAENLPMGGDLPTLVNVLRKYPRVLDAEPVVIVSVSVSGFNDLDLTGMPAATAMNWTVLDHGRVARMVPGRYFDYILGFYFPFLKRHVLHEFKGDGYACEEGARLPPALMASRGFRPDTRRMTPSLRNQVEAARPDRPGNKTATRDDFLLDGGRRKAFAVSLEWLARSPAQAILLYVAPMVPGWGDDPEHAVDMEMEAAFAALVAEDARRHPKVRFLDFVRDPPPELGVEHFADNYHLNHKGAVLFTRRLAGHLIQEGILERAGPAGEAPDRQKHP